MNQYPAHFHDWPELLGSLDVARVLQVNRSTATRLMKQDGFPLLDKEARRGLKVNKYQLVSWLRGDQA